MSVGDLFVKVGDGGRRREIAGNRKRFKELGRKKGEGKQTPRNRKMCKLFEKGLKMSTVIDARGACGARDFYVLNTAQARTGHGSPPLLPESLRY